MTNPNSMPQSGAKAAAAVSAATLALSILLAPCLPAQVTAFEGTLTDYLALGPEGVNIGDAVFSNFQLLQLQDGASGLPLDIIDVIPLFDDPDAPGFRFDIMDGATAEDFFELRFTFDVSGPSFDRVAISLFDVDILSNSNAGVDLLADLSITGSSSGGLGSLFAFAGPDGIGDLEAAGSFAATDRLTIEFDSVIDGGGEGRDGEVVASINSATLRVGRAAPVPSQPILINSFGLVDADTAYLEFVSTPLTRHVITASEALVDGFAPGGVVLTSGDGTTDADGTGRVEIDISALGRSHFFRVETSVM